MPGSQDEVIGDAPADAAASMLARVGQRSPKPTVNELLDALEAELRIAGPYVVMGKLGTQHVTSRDIVRTPAKPPADLVSLLGPGLVGIAETYRSRFDRPPSLREMLAALTFELRANPRDYVSDYESESLSKLVLVGHVPNERSR